MKTAIRCLGILMILLVGVEVGHGYQHSHRIQIIPRYSVANYDMAIQQIYRQPASHSQSVSKRLIADSQDFVGKPYLLYANGEGPKATFDQRPLYRTDAFDCLTLVSTVLALVNSNDLAEFKQNILNIRYGTGKPSYYNRNHFTTIDWNINNAKKGYIKDITREIHDKDGKSLAVRANAVIDKKSWYRKKKARSIKRFEPLSKQQTKQLLTSMRNLGANTPKQQGPIVYIPLKALFNKKGQPNNYVFDQIPSGSIVEIVRPNWQRRKDLGTNLNVSHLGFAIRTKQGLIYREASTTNKKVIDIPLAKYLKKTRRSPTIKGVNIEQVN
ncbi:MAG: hypothetical protein CMF50_09035 [Legionellales bacterium]|nr:hypothetical protein [Legionellales bacterium]|tara:strand:+ start:2509 stop:3489 length:981 start_codon:yes stop_codon:yes gene_type:complete